MPKCVICDQYIHPDMCIEIDEENKACKCVFCYTNKNEVTIEKDDGTLDHTVTKREAIESYKRYIKDLRDSDKVRQLMMKGQDNPFKM